MDTQQKALEELESQLKQAQDYEEKLYNELEEIEKKQQSIDISEDFSAYTSAKDELTNNLDETAKQVLENRKKLHKKIRSHKCITLVLSILYLIAVTVFLCLADLFTVPVYLITILIGAVGITLPLIISIIGLKKQFSKTFSDPLIEDYDAAVFELFENFKEKKAEKQRKLSELQLEKRKIENEISKTVDAQVRIVNKAENLEFNYTYKDTILFYGADRGNRYDLYLDGRLYDTVKGKEIVTIKLSPGLHSFKVNNTCYNIDKSVIYSYTFNTMQFLAGEEPEAHAIVCDYKIIKEVDGNEFQRITKTRLT